MVYYGSNSKNRKKPATATPILGGDQWLIAVTPPIYKTSQKYGVQERIWTSDLSLRRGPRYPTVPPRHYSNYSLTPIERKYWI